VVRRDADIVVVGAGIAGVATARALAATPLSVVLLERFEIGHTRGSSHGTSRIFRLNYADERFVRMAQAAGDEWRALERERGVRLLEQVGVLDLGPHAAGTARALAACGVPHQTLSAAAVAERWPLRLEPEEMAVHQADGGFLYADRAHAALLGAALEGGVELRERVLVTEITVGRGSVHLGLDGGSLTAGAVVVTAGAWAPGLLGTAGIDLPVVPTRETVVYLDLPGADALPPLIDYAGVPGPAEAGISRVGNSTYALAAPGRGLKAGLHHSGPVADPAEPGAPDEAVADWVARWSARRFVDAGPVQTTETCLYTSTADESFVLDRHGRVVIGSACSGHGFKFAPVVGRTLAALAREAVS
jgi:sarcosine oxidase